MDAVNYFKSSIHTLYIQYPKNQNQISGRLKNMSATKNVKSENYAAFFASMRNKENVSMLKHFGNTFFRSGTWIQIKETGYS